MFTVYWRMCGTDEIHHSNAVKVVDGAVVFEDDNWNPVEECFLTEEQCRVHHNLPPQEWKDAKQVVVDKLKSMIRELSDD